jgi:hypothetical protein
VTGTEGKSFGIQQKKGGKIFQNKKIEGRKTYYTKSRTWKTQCPHPAKKLFRVYGTHKGHMTYMGHTYIFRHAAKKLCRV